MLFVIIIYQKVYRNVVEICCGSIESTKLWNCCIATRQYILWYGAVATGTLPTGTY